MLPEDIAFPTGMVVISPLSTCGPLGVYYGPWASSTWTAANRAFYYPFRLTRPFTIQLFFCLNGTVVNGNLDIGIYSVDGTRLISIGSTAQAGVNVIQEVAAPGAEAVRTLASGTYYVGMSMDNNTGTIFRNSSAPSTPWIAGGTFQNAAFPLPAVATMASMGGTNPRLEMCGISSRGFI